MFTHLLAINLWNPNGAIMGIAAILLTAMLLGMVHGITPDEHTWPITFSYAVGSYSWKGGMRAGLLFSLAFTVQRAIASEIAFFAMNDVVKRYFLDVIKGDAYNFIIYIVVGAVMAASGFYILTRGKIPHLFHVHKVRAEGEVNPQAMPRYMPLVHGFIAGWGTGAFALLVYLYLAPHMGSPWIAFLPGLFFGVGTMIMQILLGGLFGQWMARRNMHNDARRLLAKLMSGRTLTWAGAAFVIVGVLGLIFPKIGDLQIDTGLKVHNLAHLGLGFFLAVIVLFAVAGFSLWRSLRDVSRMEIVPGAQDLPDPEPDGCGHHGHHSHQHESLPSTTPAADLDPNALP